MGEGGREGIYICMNELMDGEFKEIGCWMEHVREGLCGFCSRVLGWGLV